MKLSHVGINDDDGGNIGDVLHICTFMENDKTFLP